VVEKGEEWTLVESGKVTGYVKNEFLTFGEEARGLAAHYGEQGVVANWNDVSVFSQGTGDASVSGTVNDGTVLGTIQDNGHWIAVQQGAESAGYVSEEDVTRVLLVDTAVPAEGEDDEDVVVTMTAADLGASESTGAEEASAEAVYEEESYQETDSDQAYSNAPAEDYSTVQKVSDDPYIQALYEAYLKAQEAAMNCTSEEDAREKAAAATAAWNAYLAACNGTSAADTTSDNTSSAAADTTADADDEEYDEEYDDSEDDEDLTYAADDETYLDEDTSEYGEDEAEEDTSEEDTTSDAVTAASTNSSGLYGGASDLDLLAAIIWCEAGNQPHDGMVAVGQVVMNRVASSSFPNSVSEVLNQPGQFTPASAGTLQAALASGVNSNCYAAAQDAMNGVAPVPGYPMYFNTHSGTYKLGAHYFS
jgi:spore germination cell wall hydrolase CwlJ-like protein